MNRYILIVFLLLTASISFAQKYEIKGKVTDAMDNSTLPGVSVRIKGTDMGAATDIDGNFTLQAEGADILIFSFIGMKSQEVAVNNRSVINIALEAETEVLDDVVVVGYGVRKKGTVSGAISTVKDDVLKVPVASFDQALQGQVSGMSVMTSSGSPDAKSSIRIRGVNSISSGTEPLYIMDGIAISAGDFSSLNPNDIENITVLKDASSTSIYGARAANGVIVITTKRGKAGEKARVTYSGKFGFSKLAFGEWDMMNTREKLDYEELIGVRTAGTYDREELEKVDIDWRDVLYNDHAPTTSHDLSISGAGEKNNYYISMGYMDHEGISVMSSLKRYNFRTNLEARPTNWLKAGLNTTLGYTEDKHPVSSLSVLNPNMAVYLLNPYYNPYNEDGSIADSEFLNKYGVPNPLATAAKIKSERNTLKLVASGFLEVKPVRWLTLKSQLGVEGYDYRSTQKDSPDLGVMQGNGYVNESFSRTYNLTLTNLITYANTFKEKHNLTVMLGQEALKIATNSFGGGGGGYTDERFMQLGSTTSPTVSGGSTGRANYLSFFSRAEYNYDYKYYLDLSFRADGSSRFGDDNRWANFWSAGVMWDLKKESFMKNVTPITSLQLSYNVGTSGNSSIGNYEHLAIMIEGTEYNGETGIGAASLGNPALTWEKVLSHNAGINIGLWNRMRLSVEWYKKITQDMLMSVPVSMVSGFSSRRDNVGKMENSGLEVDFNIDIVKSGGFLWNLSTNFAYNKNKITALYNGQDEYVLSNTGTKLQVGKPVGSFYEARFAGVDPNNGDPLWYAKDGSITNQYSDDLMVMLNKTAYAPWTGGFTNVLSYKGVTLQAFFSWVHGRYMENNMRIFTESNGNDLTINQSKKMFRAWTPSNRFTDIPAFGNYAHFDDRILEDASFMRLKNLTLSWDLPSQWITRWSRNVVSGVRLYGQGQNLLTWTNYSGLDPEVETNVQLGNYPNTKTFIFGVDITF